MTDALQSNTIELVLSEDLYDSIHALPPEQCQEAIRAILNEQLQETQTQLTIANTTAPTDVVPITTTPPPPTAEITVPQEDNTPPLEILTSHLESPTPKEIATEYIVITTATTPEIDEPEAAITHTFNSPIPATQNIPTTPTGIK